MSTQFYLRSIYHSPAGTMINLEVQFEEIQLNYWEKDTFNNIDQYLHYMGNNSNFCEH